MAFREGRVWGRRLAVGMTLLVLGCLGSSLAAAAQHPWCPLSDPTLGYTSVLTSPSAEWDSTVFGTNGEMVTLLDTDSFGLQNLSPSLTWSPVRSFFPALGGLEWVADQLGLGPLSVPDLGPTVTVGIRNLRAAVSIGLQAFRQDVDLNLSYQIDHNSRHPVANTFRPGDTVHITSSWLPHTGGCNITSGDVEGTPRMELDVAGGFDLDLSIEYFFGSWTPGDTVSVDGSLTLPMVAPAWAGSCQFRPGVTGTWRWLRIGSEALGSGWDLSVDDSGPMTRRGEDEPLKITADFDEILMDYWKHHPPNLSGKKKRAWDAIVNNLQGLMFQKGVGPASLRVEAADLDAVFGMIGHHAAVVTPDPEITYTFDADVLRDGQLVRSVKQPARCDLCVALPEGQEDPVHVTASYDLRATLNQRFGVDLGADVIVGLVSAGFTIKDIIIWHGGCVWLVFDELCIPDFKIPGWSVGLPWAYHHRERVATIPLISASAAPESLGATWTLESFDLDPQVPPEPGFASMPYVVEEGATIELDGTASTDKDGDEIRCWWDLDYDKTFETGPDPTPVFDTRDVGGTGLLLDGPAEQWVTLAACDPYGYRTAETKVTVLNVAPTIDPLDGGSVAEGVRPDDTPTHYVEEGAFSDPGAELEEYLATVDYGDGTGTVVLPLRCDADSYPRHFTLDHIYADNGVYTVTVWVADDDGGEDTVTCTVTVSNQDPTVVAGANQDVAEGEVVELDPSTFHDFGTLDTHVAAVNWGDDAPTDVGVVTESPFGPPGSTAGLSGTVDMSHVYQMPTAHFIGAWGDYTVTITVTDDDGGVGDDTLTVRVHDAKPPELSWVERPEWADNDPEPCFTWAGVDEHTLPEDLVYSTRFNGGGWSAYASDVSICLGPLVEGWYTLEVRGWTLPGTSATSFAGSGSWT